MRPEGEKCSAFLCVDGFLRTAVAARALKSAFELGVIDSIRTSGRLTPTQLANRCGLDPAAIRLLLAMLAGHDVVAPADEDDGVRLSNRFLLALQFRDVLLAKLDFALLVASDFTDLFTHLLADPSQFFQRAKLFQLFDYGKCFDRSLEAYESAERWVTITSALTRYEAVALAELHDFSRYRSLLDVGGNSGELSRQLCRRNEKLDATVFDLPVVCDVGERHIAATPEAARIRFVRGDARVQMPPDGPFDVVTFKSVLHDWPEAAALQLLTKFAAVVRPGGSLVIFERGPFDVTPETMSFANLPMLLFFRSFRTPDAYASHLRQLGFTSIDVRWIDLEMPFFALSAARAVG